MPEVNPTLPDQITERWLADRLVKFRLVAVEMGQINTSHSRANQARIEPIDHDLAASYRKAMTRGDIFPALVGYERGAQIVLIDGNHRHEGAIRRGDVTHLFVYVCDVNEEMVNRLTGEANEKCGRPPTAEERFMHAWNDVQVHGDTVNAAAERHGLPVGDFRRRVQATMADARGVSRGFKKFGSLPMRNRLKIGSINSDPAFDALAALAIHAGTTTAAVRGQSTGR